MKLRVIILLLLTINALFSHILSAAEQHVLWRYTVRPGDNLITLGKMHLIEPQDWKQVQVLNQIKNPYRIPVGTVLSVPLALVKQSPTSAEVILVSGDARLILNNNTSEPIKMGQKLSAGATLITKNNAKVVVKFADATETTMDSNSELTLDTMSVYSGGVMVDTQLKLQKGQLKTRANPAHILGNRMRITTPTAIAAVRGTEFRVSANDKITTQETLEGAVSLSASSAEVMVNKGFGTLAEDGKPPLAPVALLAAVDTKKVKSQYNEIPLTFDLPPLAGALTYVGQIYADTTFSQVLAETEQQGSHLSFADLPDGPYFLSLRAKDKNGIAGYDAVHAFTLSARPFGPSGLLPEPNVKLKAEPPVLKWNPVAGANGYVLQVATDAEFNKLLIEQKMAENTFKFDSGLKSGEYFWRLATVITLANGQEAQGPAIKVNRFTYKAPPPTPDLSQLKVTVAQNKVFVSILPPPAGYTYQVQLDNLRNQQTKVWTGKDLNENFSFLLKEYGKQTLHFRQMDSEGDVSPASDYQFDAYPQ